MTETPRWNGQQAGYTLVEMLVVMALLSIIALLASGGLQFAGRAQQISTEDMRRVRDLVAAQRTMRTLIGNALPPVSGAQPSNANAGTPLEFQFQSDPRRSAGLSGRYSVVLRVAEAGLASRIHVSVTSEDGDTGSNVESFGPLPVGLRIAYGTVQDSGDVVWANEWTQPDRLPDLVRIAAPKAEDSWPEFVAMVRNNEPPGCRYDPVSRGCR